MIQRKLSFFVVAIGVLMPLSFVWADVGFKAGFYERVRNEFRKNVTDLENSNKDNKNFFKIKTSLWGEIDFNKDLDVYLKLTNENKAYAYWGGASAAVGKSASKKGFHYKIDEVVFDNLYADVKNFLSMPLDLRLGRQDLNDYGEGFLISEGTPIDASRTFYFNAAKTTWRIDVKNTLDLIFIKDYRTDNLLPVANRMKPEQPLNSSDETAYVLYHKSDAIKNVHLENYYIFKEEKASESSAAVARMTQQKTSLNTIGSFGKYLFSPWTLRGQLAFQFGSYGSDKRTGLGGYGYIDRDLKNVKWSPKLSAGFVYLSGNDTGTGTNEAWDPLFSRWPWFSEACGLAYTSETETYYWTNLQAYRTSVTFLPTKKTKLTFGYNFLRANERVSPTSSLFSGSGRNRGHLFQTRLDFAIKKNIAAFITAEYLLPGDFYVKKADPIVYLKSEISFSF